MAAFLIRALGLSDTAGEYFFVDNGSVVENDINRLAGAGITRGYSADEARFCPDNNQSRGAAVAFRRDRSRCSHD